MFQGEETAVLLSKLCKKKQECGRVSQTATVFRSCVFQVFKNAFIPRTLEAVIDFESDTKKAKHGETEEVYHYHKLSSLILSTPPIFLLIARLVYKA